MKFILIFFITLVSTAQQKPNVIVISVDDMNDWLGCLGNFQAKTPNIDRLAKSGVLFTNAHVAAPVCNPSRVSFYTGLYPDNTGVYENGTVFRKVLPKAITLPICFKQNGYKTFGGGKTFHDVSIHHDSQSFQNYFWWHPKGSKGSPNHGSPYSVEPDPEPVKRPMTQITKLTKRNFDWAIIDRPETDWPDVKVTDWAIDFLSGNHKKEFFLNIGIFRPHIPWYNPKKYYDMYPLESIKLPQVKANDLEDLGHSAQKLALTKSSKHNKVKSFREWKGFVRAYLASISFADEQVGRILNALKSSKYAENTIIVFWSDHGYHLGEKEHWHKRTLWRRSTRVPMIIKVPGRKPGICQQAVNTLDIYPTLVEACKLSNPPILDGTSLMPWIKSPQKIKMIPSITTYLPGNYAVSSLSHRYISYKSGEEEFYDIKKDPNEWHNLIANPDYEESIRTHREWKNNFNSKKKR